MRSRLCRRHFKGNGAFDGVWRYDSQQRTATEEALFLCYEYIAGQGKERDYRDAIYALIEIYGDDVKAACRFLWVASIPRVGEEQKLVYFDKGMDMLTKYFRRFPGYLSIQSTGPQN